VVLIAMGVLIWSGELFQLNIRAQQLLESLGLDFFNAV
jgi:cytochrome c-type biogenesis protein